MEEYKRGDIVQLIPSKTRAIKFALCLMTVEEVIEDGKRIIGYFNFPHKKILKYVAEPEELLFIGQTQWVLKNEKEKSNGAKNESA